MRNKGVEGHIMVIIISIIVGFIVLAMMWYFLGRASGAVEEGGKNMFTRLKCFTCDKLGWGRVFANLALGNFCGGCG